MSEQRPSKHSPERPYTVSPDAKGLLGGHHRYQIRQRFMLRRQWLRERIRAMDRNPIRGQLITHRRMFGVSHKSVQDGEKEKVQ